MSYDEIIRELSDLPQTWYPAILKKVIESCVSKNVFRQGGAGKFVQKVEYDAHYHAQRVKSGTATPPLVKIDFQHVTDVNALRSRILQLESYLETSADGVLLDECEQLYCPKCGRPVRQEFDLAYCDECVNPDDGCFPNQPPLPLSYSLCLSTSKIVPLTK